MIINLRGTNGSGKSTVARGLLEGLETREVELAPYLTPGGVPRVVAGLYAPARDLIVVGPYRTACGGCDAIKTQDLVKESVRRAAALACHVFFEGVIISTLYSGYRALSDELRAAGHHYTWAYLDTPLEVCLARIQARNGGKPIKENLVSDKMRSIQATFDKAHAACYDFNNPNEREDVLLVDHTEAIDQVRELLR